MLNVISCRKIWLWDFVINNIKRPKLKMVFLCFRKCSKTKRMAVHEPELIEKNSALVENLRHEFKGNTQDDRKISIDQYSHYFIDEYASGQFSRWCFKPHLWLADTDRDDQCNWMRFSFQWLSTGKPCKQENRSTTETTVEGWLKIPLLATEGSVIISLQM